MGLWNRLFGSSPKAEGQLLEAVDEALLQEAKDCFFKAAAQFAGRDDLNRLTEQQKFTIPFDAACALLVERRGLPPKLASAYVQKAILGIGK